MYLTSLFEVLPKQVTMEDIREVETLPRRYKQECEDGEFNMQQVCLSSKFVWLFLSCNFSCSSGFVWRRQWKHAFYFGDHSWENMKNHSIFVVDFSCSSFFFFSESFTKSCAFRYEVAFLLCFFFCVSFLFLLARWGRWPK